MGSLPEAIEVTVCYSPRPRVVHEWRVHMPAGATVDEALRASGLASQCPEVDLQTAVVGVWGRHATLQQGLRARDRIEVYRALTVDPKVARRERFKRQGARAAGLFARRPESGPPT